MPKQKLCKPTFDISELYRGNNILKFLGYTTKKIRDFNVKINSFVERKR